MRSLANLLEAAAARAASEVLLESGQPVVFTTMRGPEVEQKVLPRTELFDMIVAAVDDAQQVELAVGNPVRFTIDAGASWMVTAEPGLDGMTVRAQREGRASSLEIELDDQPGFRVGTSSFSVEGDLEVDFEADFTDPVRSTMVVGAGLTDSHAASRLTGPRSPSQAPPSQLKVEALDAPTLQDPESELDRMRGSVHAPASFESGTWALADEDDFDVGLDDPGEGQLPTGFPEPPPSGYESKHIGVPDDDDDASSFDPFADPPLARADDQHRQRTLSPTLPAVGAAKRETPPASSRAPIEPARPRPSVAETPTRRELAEVSQSATRRELSPLGSPEADTHRELPTVARPTIGFGALTTSIGEGALVYVCESGLADTLAQSFAAPSVTVDDQIAADEVWARVRGLPVGTIVIVRREDPSKILDWILRRLEEGYRVFVETRARTVEGARWILLGVGASERAEQWLDRQVTLVVEPGEGGPRVRELG